jgi:hypothetical protein
MRGGNSNLCHPIVLYNERICAFFQMAGMSDNPYCKSIAGAIDAFCNPPPPLPLAAEEPLLSFSPPLEEEGEEEQELQPEDYDDPMAWSLGPYRDRSTIGGHDYRWRVQSAVNSCVEALIEELDDTRVVMLSNGATVDHYCITCLNPLNSMVKSLRKDLRILYDKLSSLSSDHRLGLLPPVVHVCRDFKTFEVTISLVWNYIINTRDVSVLPALFMPSAREQTAPKYWLNNGPGFYRELQAELCKA